MQPSLVLCRNLASIPLYQFRAFHGQIHCFHGQNMSYHVKMVKIWKKIFLKTENEKMAWRRNQYHYILECSLREARGFWVCVRRRRGQVSSQSNQSGAKVKTRKGERGNFMSKPNLREHGTGRQSTPPPRHRRGPSDGVNGDRPRTCFPNSGGS